MATYKGEDLLELTTTTTTIQGSNKEQKAFIKEMLGKAKDLGNDLKK
ncbi:hypothetical protein [Tenacibaculum maritimum]|nr:hypothetical protein [Tenacibaculum maritimum]MCD9611553.1 hypothetical protein [Tenacibaculum maritimum]